MGFYFNIDLRFVYASNADRANNYANLSEPVLSEPVSSSFDLDIYSLLDHAAQLSGVLKFVITSFENCLLLAPTTIHILSNFFDKTRGAGRQHNF